MSAFDGTCTRSTADSSWDYKNVIFIDIKETNVHYSSGSRDIETSISSNSYTDRCAQSIGGNIIDNLNKCQIN